MKNGEAEALINYLVGYIENSLNEIAESKPAAGEFVTGEAYAYIECLEIILAHMGVSAEELIKLEKRYGVE